MQVGHVRSVQSQRDVVQERAPVEAPNRPRWRQHNRENGLVGNCGANVVHGQRVVNGDGKVYIRAVSVHRGIMP
jgi:hypothetical protein